MVKKFSILLIKIFGLLLMLLSGFNFIKNILLLSGMDSIYTLGYFLGSLISLILGYMLFRLKVKNTSEIKKFLEESIYLYELYDKSDNETKRNEFIKHALLNGTKIDLQKKYYYLKLSRIEDGKVREWNSIFVLCMGEAVALKACYESHVSNKTRLILDLNEPIKAQIIEVSLKEILEDEEKFDNFIYRIRSITKYKKEEIKSVDDSYELLWHFEGLTHDHLLVKKDTFIVPNDKGSNLSLDLLAGYSELINGDGKYGVVYIDSALTQKNYKIVLPFEYHYINIAAYGTAEVQKEKAENITDYKNYICDILDLKTKKSYTSNAIVNSIISESFIQVDTDGLLEFVALDTENSQIKNISKKYETIIPSSSYQLKPVQDSNTKLWGYIDKTGSEIIGCKYSDWNFFNDGYAVLMDDDKFYVIDINENIIIEPKYEKIVHHKDNLFFVKSDDTWAVFKDSMIYVDFMSINLDNDYEITAILKNEIKKKKEIFHSKRYELPLWEYVKLFDEFKSQKDLEDAGLWWHFVHVKQIPERFKDIIQTEDCYTIGWQYPSSASIFDMKVELPVIFTKTDGTDLSLGINLEDLELIVIKEEE